MNQWLMILAAIAGAYIGFTIYKSFFKKKKVYKTLAHYATDGKEILNERPPGMSMKKYRELRAEQTRVLRHALHGNDDRLFRNEKVNFEWGKE